MITIPSLASIPTPTGVQTRGIRCSFWSNSLDRAELLLRSPQGSVPHTEGLKIWMVVRPPYAKLLNLRIKVLTEVLDRPDGAHYDGTSWHESAGAALQRAKQRLQRLTRIPGTALEAASEEKPLETSFPAPGGAEHIRDCCSFYSDSLDHAELLLQNPPGSFLHSQGLKILTAVRPSYAKLLSARIKGHLKRLSQPDGNFSDGRGWHEVARERLQLDREKLLQFTLPPVVIP